MSISAVLIVYNEEARLESTLKSFAWCDEIIVADRNSSDRTREIARKYTGKIFLLESKEYSPHDNKAWLDNVTSDWVVAVTASDVIHPALATEIKRLTSLPDFPYDVIDIPFRRYVLGLETPRSPWYSELNTAILFRRSVVGFDPASVHGAIKLNTQRHYKMPNSDKACMYHLTHSTADMMMDRHMIYWRAESRVYPETAPLRKVFVDLLRGTFVVIFKRRTWLLGWDGVALIMAYLSYWMLRFVYIWERRRRPAGDRYGEIRAGVLKAWENAADHRI